MQGGQRCRPRVGAAGQHGIEAGRVRRKAECHHARARGGLRPGPGEPVAEQAARGQPQPAGGADAQGEHAEGEGPRQLQHQCGARRPEQVGDQRQREDAQSGSRRPARARANQMRQMEQQDAADRTMQQQIPGGASVTRTLRLPPHRRGGHVCDMQCVRADLASAMPRRNWVALGHGATVSMVPPIGALARLPQAVQLPQLGCS